MADRISVEVVFALPDRQLLSTVELDAGATVGEAIAESRLTGQFPGEQIDSLPTGIWGRPADRDQPLKDGDRVEIYRPLEIDPRDARRRLARIGKTMRTARDA